MKRNLRRTSLLLLAIFAVAATTLISPQSANAINLTYNDNLKDIQQTFNSPCVIGSPSCNNVLPYTTVPGGPGSQDLFSPTYTVSQLVSTVGSTAMNILIDVNQSGGDFTDAISLQLFTVNINGGAVEFALFPVPQNVPTAGSLNGNGYSDAGMMGLDLSAYGPNDTVVFHAIWSNQTDGQESFFLAATNAPRVPEPASVLLIALGLVGVGVGAVRNRSK
jgi:PEP-CTERM motif